MKRRRDEDFKEEIEDYGAVVKIPKQIGNKNIFDILCVYLDAIYIGTRFMRFIIPEKEYKLLLKIRTITDDNTLTVDTFLNKDWDGNTTVMNHKIARVVLFLDEYNKQFSLSGNMDRTYGSDIETIRQNNTRQYKESELFGRDNILSLYINNNVIKPWEWGPAVMVSVNDYIKTCDRKYIDMGNKKMCLKLLNGPYMALGLVRPCIKFTDHPPLPVNKNTNTEVFFKCRKYYPTPTFKEIESYDKDELPFEVSNTNIIHHHLDDYSILNGKETLMVSLDNYRIKNDEFVSISINEYKSFPKNIKNVVLVFKNHGQRKTCEFLDHVLCKGLKRTSSLFKYIVPDNKLKNMVFYTYVKKYQ